MVGTNSPLVLPEGLKKIAEEQLGETPEILEASLKTLREKIAQLPEAERITDTTDENIVRFLRARKFKIDEALERTVQYARFYVKYGQVLEGMKAEEFMMFSEFMTVLKDRDREGRVMLVLQPKKGIGIFTKEFVKQHPRAMLRCNVWMFERLSHDVNVQVGYRSNQRAASVWGRWRQFHHVCAHGSRQLLSLVHGRGVGRAACTERHHVKRKSVCVRVFARVCVFGGGRERERGPQKMGCACVSIVHLLPVLTLDRLASNRFVAFDSSTHSGT